MGDAKRRREYMEKLADASVERISGYDCGEGASPLMQGILDLFHAEANKSPTGYLDSQDITVALTFHLVQTLRAMPPHYKQKKIDEVCDSIREMAHLPFKSESVFKIGDEVGDA